MEWYYWLLIILGALIIFGKQKKVPKNEHNEKHANKAIGLDNKEATDFKDVFDEIKAGNKLGAVKLLKDKTGWSLKECKDWVDSSQRIENSSKSQATLEQKNNNNPTTKKILNISEEIPFIKASYSGFFDDWNVSNYIDLDFIQNNFSKFCSEYSLTNNFSDEDNKIRFKTGEEVVEDSWEITTHPFCDSDIISKLQNLTTSYYSKNNLDTINSLKSMADNFRSFPIHDEINNFNSKKSLRTYFHAIEISFLYHLEKSTGENEDLKNILLNMLNNMKKKYGETNFKNSYIRDDLYKILMNISKMMDELINTEIEINRRLEASIYNENYYSETGEVTDFEFFGSFRKKYEGKVIDGRWYDGFLKTDTYYYYCFKRTSTNKERIVSYERNFVKLTEMIINSVTFYELILNDFNDDEKYNKYLILKLDIEKQDLLLSHFEGSMLDKMDKINFNFIELKNILIKNNIQVLDSLEKINQNLNNMSQIYNEISVKLEKVGQDINGLNTTNKWNNVYQAANLYYNYKSFKLLKN
jgi:hypothetical protein